MRYMYMVVYLCKKSATGALGECSGCAQGAIELGLGFILLAPPFKYHKNKHYRICILDNC